jgi:hypothetical protein
MSKLAAIVLTAAVCLPLGALLRSQAHAQPAVLEPAPSESHFLRAQLALHVALDELQASWRAGEDVWHDAQGHASRAQEQVARATELLDRAVQWATPPASPGLKRALLRRQTLCPAR